MISGNVREPFLSTLKRGLFQLMPVFVAVMIGTDLWRGKASWTRAYAVDQAILGLVFVVGYSLLVLWLGCPPAATKTSQTASADADARPAKTEDRSQESGASKPELT